MSEVYYKQATWLNGMNSRATGSIVCLDAIDNRNYRFTGVEISDCDDKVSIHAMWVEDNALQRFHQKLQRMIIELQKFDQHIIKEMEKED